MKKLLRLTVLPCFVVLLGCKTINANDPSLKEYPIDWVKFETNDLVMCYPDTLQIDTTFIDLEFILRSKKTKEGDFLDNFCHAVEERNFHSDQEMRVALVQETRDLLENVVITNVHHVKVNGRKYLKIKGYGQYYDKEIAFEQYSTVIDSRILSFNLTGIKSDEETYFPIFRTIFESLKLGNSN